MNATQRKFLVEKIQTKVKTRIEEVRKGFLEYPSASNYLFKAILNNELKLQDETTILEALKSKAMNAKEGANWLSDERLGMNRDSTVRLPLNSLVVLPDDYYKALQEVKEVKEVNERLNSEIKELKSQLDTIEVRIQLASDKTLQKMINEVDDMGDISLLDTKLKYLN
jgi:LPS O-antigen subunit length determinant protein (WzzB/FepE family)